MNTNQLYPIFLRLDKIKVLLIGAGEVGLEKLHFMLKSSPNAHVTIIAPEIRKEILDMQSSTHYNIKIIEKKFEKDDVFPHDIIIAATNIKELNQQVHYEAKHQGKLVNVADTPELCDFYMGAIVTRGDLKVAISTNGKSPTFAKRFRQWLEEILPESTDNLIQQLHQIRNNLKGDFNYKVESLNEITKSLVERDHLQN